MPFTVTAVVHDTELINKYVRYVPLESLDNDAAITALLNELSMPAELAQMRELRYDVIVTAGTKYLQLVLAREAGEPAPAEGTYEHKLLKDCFSTMERPGN